MCGLSFIALLGLISTFPFFVNAANEISEECGQKQEMQIEKCIEPMIILAGHLNSFDDFKTSETGMKTLDKICNNYKSFHECSREIHCNSSSLKAVEASYGYMCTTGYEKFAGKVQCFTQVESSPSYQTCRILASRSFSFPQSTTMNEPFDVKSLDKLCDAMRSYLKCSKNALLQVCDESAWHLVLKMTVESIRITMPDCDIDILED